MLSLITRIMGRKPRGTAFVSGRPVDAGTTLHVTRTCIAGRVLGHSLCVYCATEGARRWSWEADDGRTRPMTGQGFESWADAWWDAVQSIEDACFGAH